MSWCRAQFGTFDQRYYFFLDSVHFISHLNRRMNGPLENSLTSEFNKRKVFRSFLQGNGKWMEGFYRIDNFHPSCIQEFNFGSQSCDAKLSVNDAVYKVHVGRHLSYFILRTFLLFCRSFCSLCTDGVAVCQR
jgi:hypothetical protein